MIEKLLVAELPDNRRIIGVVRLIIDPDGKSGEYAVLVGDQWQGFGLGLKFMGSLIEIAKDKHLEKIYGYVMANNYKMLKLCNGLEFKAEKIDDETLMVSLDVC